MAHSFLLILIISSTSFAILARIVANPLANVFQKQLTQRSADPLFIISATYGFLTIACFVFWPQLRFGGMSTEFWQSVSITGLLAMIGNVFMVKALQIGDLSVLGPINAYKSIVGLIIGIFLLNEIPSWWGIVGILLIIGGSYIVLTDKQQSTGFSWQVFQRPEVKLRLSALVFSAADGAFLKKAILLSTPTIAFFYWCLFGFAFTAMWILLTKRNRWHVQLDLLRQQKFTFVALFVSVGVTQMTSNIVLERIEVGYALALFQTSALVSVLFGYQFFSEQGIIRKLIGAGVMVIGAVIITVFG